MGYIDYMTINQMKEFDLFDDIPYKYIKKILEKDGDEMLDVEIKNLKCGRSGCCKTSFTFEISLGKIWVWDTEDTYKEFVVEKEYMGSSNFALLMHNLYVEDDQDDEDEEEEDDEDDDDED